MIPEIQTVLFDAFSPEVRRKPTFGLCLFVLFCLLLAVLASPRWVSAAPNQKIHEIVIDHAVISSPQTTLDSLLRLTDTYHELVHEDGITFENQERLRIIRQQVGKLFDLRDIPPKYQQNVAAESVVYLREALARFPLPPMEEVPDEDGMITRISNGKAPIYRILGTPMVIKKTEAGVYEGRYQFTPATIAEARNWYEVAEAYPYLEGQGKIAGLYEDYFSTPGPLIPVALVRELPEWMQDRYLDQAVWQWLLVLATVLVFTGLVLLLYTVVKRSARSDSRLRYNLVFILWPIGTIYLTLGARHFLHRQVFLSGEILQDVLFASKLIILAAAVSLIMRLGNILMELILAARQFDTRQIERQLVRLGVRILSILIAVIVVIEGMQQIGFSLATLVAGAGVTGLAIALAAQDTLKNVFGGLLLALDRPFEVGQRVRMKGYEGFIQEVGLRSTKVRTIRGHQIIIPNDEAARIEVENIGRRPNIRRDLNVTITYDTPPEKIARAVEILREILAVPVSSSGEAGESHPNDAINQPEYPPRVYFSDLNADSLNLLVVYWFHPPDQWLSLEFADHVNMQIIQRFNAEGIDFAFPSQTMYLAGDDKRPLNLGQQPSPPRTTSIPTTRASSTTSTVKRPILKKAETAEEATIEAGLPQGEMGSDSDDAGDSSG